MPATIKRLTKAGLVDVAFAADSLSEAARHEPDQGVYTVSNTFNRTQTLLLGRHLDRLEDSARREGMTFRYDRGRLRSALRRLIVDSDYGDVRFRISVPADAPDEMILSIEPFAPPSAALLRSGARCHTSMLVRHNPAAKTIAWMRRRRELEQRRPPGVYEIFLLDSAGALLEGISSNVYAILDGELRTAFSGVLAGVSRSIVLEVRQGILPLRREAANISERERFSEMFLSSSSRGLVPVVELDGEPIGDGLVGRLTLSLRAAYQRWVAANLEEL